MHDRDYEKTKDEAWQEFIAQTNGPLSIKQTFDYAYDEAYRVGVLTGKYGEIAEKPEGEADHIPDTTKKVDRTMIAAMAMQGLLANAVWVQTKITHIQQEHSNDIDKCGEELKREIAEDAVEFADALIMELDKEKK